MPDFIAVLSELAAKYSVLYAVRQLRRSAVQIPELRNRAYFFSADGGMGFQDKYGPSALGARSLGHHPRRSRECVRYRFRTYRRYHLLRYGVSVDRAAAGGSRHSHHPRASAVRIPLAAFIVFVSAPAPAHWKTKRT